VIELEKGVEEVAAYTEVRGVWTKMTVFWNDEPCSLVEIARRFRGTYCLHHEGDEGPTSQKCHLYTRSRKNLFHLLARLRKTTEHLT
jgi:hypothetical protein